MSKSTVSKLFVGAALTMVVGVVVAIVVVLAAIAGGTITFGGPDVVTIDGGAFAGTVLWLIVAGLAITGATVAGIVSWVGALLNTAQLEDKTWFIVLLVLGLLSFGFVAMLVYVLAGPDGTATPQQASAPPTGGQLTA